MNDFFGKIITKASGPDVNAKTSQPSNVGDKSNEDKSLGNNLGNLISSYGSPEMLVLKRFDRDGDGKISENDFVISVKELGLGSIGESAVRKIFKKFDKNNNGKLEFTDALNAIKALKSSSK